jgi:hypothetical protein
MSATDDSSVEAPGQPSPQDGRGLRNRLNRISHFDLNVRDLERSRQWYEATTVLIEQIPPPNATLDSYGIRRAYPQTARAPQSQVAGQTLST